MVAVEILAGRLHRNHVLQCLSTHIRHAVETGTVNSATSALLRSHRYHDSDVLAGLARIPMAVYTSWLSMVVDNP